MLYNVHINSHKVGYKNRERKKMKVVFIRSQQAGDGQRGSGFDIHGCRYATAIPFSARRNDKEGKRYPSRMSWLRVTTPPKNDIRITFSFFCRRYFASVQWNKHYI